MFRKRTKFMLIQMMMFILVMALSMPIGATTKAEGTPEVDYVADWMFDYEKYGGKVSSECVIKSTEGTVYSFVQSIKNEDTFLFAISNEGKLLWKSKIPARKGSSSKNRVMIDEITLLTDGTIVTATGSTKADSSINGDVSNLTVYAFAPDGKLKWEYAPKDTNSNRLVAMPDGNLYILPNIYYDWPNTSRLVYGPVSVGTVYGLNSSGKVVLNKQYTNFSHMVALADGSQVVFQNNGTKLLATVFKKGKKLTQYDLGNSIFNAWGTNQYGEVFVHYYTISGKDYNITAKLEADGKWLWKKNVENARFFNVIEFSLDGDPDAIDSQGRIIRYDRMTGKAVKLNQRAFTEATYLLLNDDRMYLGDYYYYGGYQAPPTVLNIITYKDKPVLVKMSRVQKEV